MEDGKRAAVQARNCSVERTLTLLGDRWFLFILREAFFGVRYSRDFVANLGIATNILSGRLKTLVEHGILERRREKRDRRRVAYRLTEKGRDLYDVTLALIRWGDRWLAGSEGPPLLLTHTKCGRRLDAVMCCATCGERIDPREVQF